MRDDRPPLATHDTEIRVRYPECDPMGVAHHATYPIWFEIGRTEMLRARGGNYRLLEAEGVFLAVVRLEVRYRRPARYDDLLATGRARQQQAEQPRVVQAGEQRLGDAPGLFYDIGRVIERLAEIHKREAEESLYSWSDATEGRAGGDAPAGDKGAVDLKNVTTYFDKQLVEGELDRTR